jgi:hypothetical protein
MTQVTWSQYFLFLGLLLTAYYTILYLKFFRGKRGQPAGLSSSMEASSPNSTDTNKKNQPAKSAAANIVGEAVGLPSSLEEDDEDDAQEEELQQENKEVQGQEVQPTEEGTEQQEEDQEDEEENKEVEISCVEISLEYPGGLVDDEPEEYYEEISLQKLCDVMDAAGRDDLEDGEKFKLVKDVAIIAANPVNAEQVINQPAIAEKVLEAVEDLQGTEYEHDLPDVSFLSRFRGFPLTETEKYFSSIAY